MSDVINSLNDMEELFWTVTAKILGYDTSLQATQGKVRISWLPAGAPSWKITDDITFLSIVPDDDYFAKQRDVSHSEFGSTNATRTIKYTRVFGVSWICYGPNSFDNIEKIRNGIFVEIYRNFIAAKNMYLLPDIGMPRRAPELLNGQWWERSDLSARYNEGVERNATVNRIDSARIYTQKG